MRRRAWNGRGPKRARIGGGAPFPVRSFPSGGSARPPHPLAHRRHVQHHGLAAHQGDVQATAHALATPRNTLYNRLHRHGIDQNTFRGGGVRGPSGAHTRLTSPGTISINFLWKAEYDSLLERQALTLDRERGAMPDDIIRSTSATRAFRTLQARALNFYNYCDKHLKGNLNSEDFEQLEKIALTNEEINAADHTLASIINKYNKDNSSNIPCITFEKYCEKYQNPSSGVLEGMREISRMTLMWCHSAIMQIESIEGKIPNITINYWGSITNNHNVFNNIGPTLIAGSNNIIHGGIHQNSHLGNGADASDVVLLIKLLISGMEKEETTPDIQDSLTLVRNAAEAAERNDVKKAAELLAGAGKWALKVAEKIGIDVAVSALKSNFGL